MDQFNVGIVGCGYVGLVTGACLAHVGHRVACVDKDEARVAELVEGRVPIYEPGLEELVSRGRKRLSFVTDLPGVVRDSDVLFIAVDTPPGEDGAADLSSVGAVARSVGRALAEVGREGGPARERPLVVVNKSTVPVGSGDYVSMLVREGAQEVVANGTEAEGEVDYRVVSNPEFLREGGAVYDSLFRDRIVLGAEKRDALYAMRALYEPIFEQSFPTLLDTRPRDMYYIITIVLTCVEKK